MDKEISDLKFSDFIGSGHQYDHSQENVWKALGCDDPDQVLKVKVLSVFQNEKNNTLSKCIEGVLALDLPAPWKAAAFMKMGETGFKNHIMEVVMEAPDTIPVPVLKGLFLIAVQRGGM